MRSNLTGFSPDLDPTTEGVLTDCDAIVPLRNGLAAANSPVTAGYPALAETPRAAFVAELLDGTKRTFVGTTTKIQEATTGTWTDQSRAGGYSGANRQRFAVFGNAVLATNRSEIIQQALPGGAFTDIATSPQALILVAASGFMVALNINGMTLGDVPDGWGCSAIRNHTLWTPSASTQCVAGRLLDSPGAILAGAPLGANVVAYKATSMYVGRYAGPPTVWDWTRVPGDIGCSGNESVVVVGTRHFFVGKDDFFMFDGTVPVPIGSPVRKWFFENLSSTNRSKIIGVADLARDLVYWYFPSVSSSGGLIDSCLIYNIQTQQWGKWAVSIQAAVQYSSGQVTYDSLGTLYSTYDSLPDISYDSPFWLADQTLPGVLIGNTLYSLTGTPGNSFVVTGDAGDLTDYSMLRRVTPRWIVKPVAAQGTNYYKMAMGDDPIQDATVSALAGRFDYRRTARFHRLRIAQQGACTLTGLDADLAPAGAR